MIEQWEKIYSGYLISTCGNVDSVKYKSRRRLKSAINKRGYLYVTLQIGGKPKYCAIHRLVAQAFIPNPHNLPQVNHLNGIKTDNRVENLEWCTASENMRHAFATGLAPQGVNQGQAKLNAAQVRYIRLNPDNLKQKYLANMFHVTQTVISLIQRGKTYRSLVAGL